MSLESPDKNIQKLNPQIMKICRQRRVQRGKDLKIKFDVQLATSVAASIAPSTNQIKRNIIKECTELLDKQIWNIHLAGHQTI